MAKVQTKTGTKVNTKETTFKLIAPYANSVSVVGDFNKWDTSSHPMKKDWKDDWTLSVKLKPGRYEYKFYVDGIWQNDSNCDICVPNKFGGTNCVIEVK